MIHQRRRHLLDAVSEPADLRRLAPGMLPRLADELRAELVETVAATGGHLGASLGVVELTIALHAVFDTPDDRLVWDVGHQSYPHKMLTGRRKRMGTLRQRGGLSGFTRRAESIYDPFGAAHSSTSISAALGMAVARDAGGEHHEVVAVIGDGALGAGMAFEALNHAGAQGRRLIVVLNDNDMSIAEPVGALRAHLAEMREGGRGLFESLGFTVVGPVDGHDLPQMIDTFRHVRASEWRGPVLVHVVTEKGYGYAPAARAADRGHSMGRFEPLTGQTLEAPAAAPSYTSVFARALMAEAEADPHIVALTAAMPDGTGIGPFAKRFPDRAFDVGIAEQHCVTFAAGLAAEGMKPFVAIYSTFLQRAYDQVVHDVALQRLPVRFAIDRAGLVGADGPTHLGAYDLAFLTCLPHMVVMAAADEVELTHMVATAAQLDDGPSALRYPRGNGLGLALPERGTSLEIGRGRILREGSRAAVLCLGAPLADCLAAADLLASEGIEITVADARFAKPLDGGLVEQLARHHEVLVTIEHGASGGFSAMVLTHLARAGLCPAVVPLTLPDRLIEHASPAEQLADAGLSPLHIAQKVTQALVRRAGLG